MNDDIPPPNLNLMNRAIQITLLAMGIVVICVAIALVIVVLNERSTQSNADFQVAQNQALQDELRCLRQPTLAYDRELAELQLAIARALVTLGEGKALDDLIPELNEETQEMGTALEAREISLIECTQP